MKLRKMISKILKAFGYVVGFLGVFFALGSVGGAVKDVMPLSAPGIYLVETDRADFGVSLQYGVQ
jgi:hypothetical protein